MHQKSIFLSAKWEYLAMLNYEVPEAILMPYLPKGTCLDLRNGKAFVSIVGFMFNNTKVFGINWPLHTNFEEVNLRFYIKRLDGTQWKRGVAFISEIVPKPIIAHTANLLYNEHYKAMPMRHAIEIKEDNINVKYEWKYKSSWNAIQLNAQNNPYAIGKNTDEEFIFEHYWGYNQVSEKKVIEYGVEHERWQVFPVKDYKLYCNIEDLYGKAFLPYLSQNPHSVFLAKGSSVIVRKPTFIYF